MGKKFNYYKCANDGNDLLAHMRKMYPDYKILAYCQLAAQKYIFRFDRKKDPVLDVTKAITYLSVIKKILKHSNLSDILDQGRYGFTNQKGSR